MAEKTALPKSLYAFGEGEESAEANRRYEDAYNQLIAAVEKRNQPQFFDPTLLAISQAFLGPTKTGSFGEAAGVAAGNVAKAQESEQTRAEELAKMRLELAGMGVERASQRGIVQNLAKKAGMAPAGTVPTETAPTGTAAAQPAVKSPEIEEGLEPIGRFPVNPSLIRSEQDFYRRALESGQRDPVAIGKEWVEYQKNFLSPKFEGGNVYDPISGNIYSKTTGGTATTTFMTGQGGSFAIPEASVREHQRLIAAAQKNPNNPEVWDRLETFEDFWRKPHTRPVKTPAFTSAPLETAQTVAQVPAQPVVQVPTQPVGQAPAPAGSVAQPPAQAPAVRPGATAAIPPPPTFSAPLRFTPVQRPPGRLSAEQKAAYDAEDKTRLDAALALQKEELAAQRIQYEANLAEGKAQRDVNRAVTQAEQIAENQAGITESSEVKKENRKDERETIVELKKAGRNQANIADQFAKLVTDYPNAIGTAAKPGFLSAGIKLLESGASIGGETAKASSLQEAVATLTGNQEELSARRVMMGLAAEYLFNLRSLAKGQGAITDYETRILSSIGPSIEDDPKTARFKAAIMKMHGEGEIARANDFNEWKKSNKDKGWRDYLGSKEYDKFAAKYDQDLARAYDIYLGRRPTAAQPSAQPRQTSNPALDFARSLK
jgi:hypothetical protein